MPTKPLHGCTSPRCPNLTDQRYCPAHRTTERPRTEEHRPSASARGYGRKWQEASKGYLAHHPLCVYCSTPKRPVGAQCVDHVIPHRGDMALFWDRNNWAASCLACNSAKAAKEEGGFGNRVEPQSTALTQAVPSYRHT